MTLLTVKAQTFVDVDLESVIQAWMNDFLEKLPMMDSIVEITIDPETKRPTAVWDLGSDDKPSYHAGNIDVSCKDVILYSIMTQLLDILALPDADRKFIQELGTLENNAGLVDRK